MDVCEGSVSGTCETACSNTTPSLASRDAATVSKDAPYGARWSRRSVSMVTMTTLAPVNLAPSTWPAGAVTTPLDSAPAPSGGRSELVDILRYVTPAIRTTTAAMTAPIHHRFTLRAPGSDAMLDRWRQPFDRRRAA